MLDPQAKAMLDAMPPMPDFDVIPLELIRQGMAAQSALSPGDPPPVAKVENRTIPGPAGEIPVRVYTPDGVGPFPVLVYYHGGGFVLCDLDTHDGTCRELANGAGAVVETADSLVDILEMRHREVEIACQLVESALNTLCSNGCTVVSLLADFSGPDCSLWIIQIMFNRDSNPLVN